MSSPWTPTSPSAGRASHARTTGRSTVVNGNGMEAQGESLMEVRKGNGAHCRAGSVYQAGWVDRLSL
ncbi:hypothetical protein GCM10015536_47720 [Streptomyces griseomycini]|nr:hypothetical protein GCM10015536_47720 [Streptomyces griseomycini]